MSKVVFHRPPLGDTHTVDQMYEWHRVHSPDAAAFMFSNEDDSGPPMTTLTWKELGEGIIRGMKMIEDNVAELRGGTLSSAEQVPIVVGLLATSDILTYTTFIFSHVRLTHPVPNRRALVPFLISPRNSATAISHLITITGTRYLWTTDGPMRALSDQALLEGGLRDTKILQMPSFHDLFTSTPLPTEVPIFSDAKLSMEQPAVILHSSGSTSFPKARPLSHRILLDWSKGFDQSELNGLGEIMAAHTLPAFHAIGMYLSCWAPVTGFIRCVPSPHTPFVPITPEYSLEQVVKSKSTIVAVVPTFLDVWSKDQNSIEKLRSVKTILWGGAPLRPDIGKYLFEQGLPIQGVFGATEFGVVTSIAKTRYEDGYEWFKFLPHITPALIPEPGRKRVFELAFKNAEQHHLAVFNTEIESTPAYATNDIIELHPTNLAMFRVLGRKDDQIMLSTGENTNPGPLETIIENDAHVRSAVMFGRGRFQNGVLIEPTSYEESVQLGLEQFRNLIWPSIEVANSLAPAYSRIFKEMILLAHQSKPFQYTFKGNVRRGVTITNYEAEIDALYRSVEDTSHVDIPIPDGSSESGGWRLEEGMEFVREVVKRVMNGVNGIQDDDDIFVLGCDSLQATYIRNSLLHALRQVIPPPILQTVPSNFVYQELTIRRLALFVVGMTRTGAMAAVTELEAERNRTERLDTMIARYTQSWPVHCPSKDFYITSGETILLTGSTGALGSQLLAQLVAIPTVSRIYALNRPRTVGKSSRARHVEAFLDRGNDVALLDSPKVTFIDGDISIEGFGIDAALYNEIRDSVTTLILNAWPVHFNTSLASFEPSISSVKMLIDFALQSPHVEPPRVMFTSSIGIMKAWADIHSVPEGPITDVSLLNSSGYTESKWVAERIISAAGRETALRPIIVRIGQLCGGINGNWNAREWFPALVRASQVVGGVPELRGLVSFLPLHVAAAALIELRKSPHEFAHLVHPRPVTWTSISRHVAKALNLPPIPYQQWLHRLEAAPTSHEALHNNPALHLIDFYRVAIPSKNSTNVDDREAMGFATYECTQTLAEASTLRPENLPQLEKTAVDTWIRYWRKKGTLDNQQFGDGLARR